ncbi:MAG: DUF1194 domain-containing protein [Paracoccaceae bacterium]
MAAQCRLALALGFDISRSVDAADYDIQRYGVTAALQDPQIRNAFLAPPEPVALAIFEWGGQTLQTTVQDWRLIESGRDLDAVIAAITAHRRPQGYEPTAIGAALRFAAARFDEAPDCATRTLDLSGDGRNNSGPPPGTVYADTDFSEVIINALAIGGHEADIVDYYAREVIRGPGAFVIAAQSHRDFPRAIREKLERELTTRLIGEAAAPLASPGSGKGRFPAPAPQLSMVPVLPPA